MSTACQLSLVRVNKTTRLVFEGAPNERLQPSSPPSLSSELRLDIKVCSYSRACSTPTVNPHLLQRTIGFTTEVVRLVQFVPPLPDEEEEEDDWHLLAIFAQKLNFMIIGAGGKERTHRTGLDGGQEKV